MDRPIGKAPLDIAGRSDMMNDLPSAGDPMAQILHSGRLCSSMWSDLEAENRKWFYAV